MESALPHENPDYLAKDYDSFRALMLDHLAKTAPAWSERDAADVVVALVEVLAYVGDYLSYYQDAVAAEAYLATARRRATVRRHARLVDYRMGEGVSARVLVQLAPAVSEVRVPQGCALLAETPGLGTTVSDDDYEKYDGIVFETMHAAVLVREHTTMRLADGEAPRPGDVRACLRGRLTRLQRGDILLLQHLESDFAHPVRLVDAVAYGATTALQWHEGDAIPAGAPAAGTWTVHGNLILADHGRTRECALPPLPTVGPCTTTLRCGQLAHVCPYDHAAALSMAVAGALNPDGATAEAAMVLRERAAFLPNDGPARAIWTARRDILHAFADERVFVAEPDGNGDVELRFGDGACGRRPGQEWTYHARYRVGQGVQGNVSPRTMTHVVGLHGLISGVVNPIGGSGGADPETLEHARAMAPLPGSRPVDANDRIADLFDGQPFADASPADSDDGSSRAPSRTYTAPVAEELVPKEQVAKARREGAGHLSRRTMSYVTFLRRMRHLASREPPLDRLNTAAEGDITNALMSAWARVCDVLAFYQMRIAEEGFIGSAREPRSIRHLAHLLGVTFRPALGASTHLAATLFEGGRPEGIVVEPGALSVQDAPTNARQQPVIFESSARVTLRPAWNEITPLAVTTMDAPYVWKGCTSVRVVGTATGARPDRAVLISAQGEVGLRTWLVTIATVLVDRRSETTLLAWDDGLPDDGGPWPAEIVELVLFQSSVGLFGRTAPPWSSLPEAKRLAAGVRAGGLLRLPLSGVETEGAAWVAVPGDLPADADVRAMLATPSGALLAGTSKGVYRSTDDGGRWVRMMLAALVPSIFALHAADDGAIYAGGAKGAMFASVDDGQTWAQMPAAIAAEGGSSNGARAALGCTIRSIVSVASGSAWLPVIGTDLGVYKWTSAGWAPGNDGLPGKDDSSPFAQVSVRALLMTANGGLAATNAGLYAMTSNALSALFLSWASPFLDWSAPSWRTTALARPAFALISVADDAGLAAVLVGTDDGVFDVIGGVVKPSSGDRSREKDLAGCRVLRLTRIGDRLLAATDAGLFSSPRQTRSWRACDTQSLDLSFDADDRWRRALRPGPAPPPLLDFLAAQGVELTRPVTVSQPEGGPRQVWQLREAETPGRAAGVLELVDGDPLVVRRYLPLPGPAVVVAAASGQLLAAVPFGELLNHDWPGFHIARGHVFLDRAIEDLEPGQRFALAPADGRTKHAPKIYVIQQAARTLRTAFGKTATVTELTTTPDAWQQVLDLRQTLAHVAPTPLLPYAPLVQAIAPVEGDRLTVAVAPDGLQAGHALLISGPRPAATIVRMGGIMTIDGLPRPPSLQQEAVLALATAGRAVFAATASGLVVEWSEGAAFRAANEGLPLGGIVHALAVHPNGSAIVAAMAGHGVFCRRLSGGNGGAAAPRWFLLGQPEGASIEVLAVTPDGHVLAGTSGGVSICAFGRDRDAPDWTQPAIGRPAHALAVGADGRCFAGLDHGAVWSRSPEADWAPLPAIVPASRVNALAVGNGGMLVAGCEDGRAHLHTDRSGWRPVCRVPQEAAIGCLLIADRRLFIGTSGAGAFEWVPGQEPRPVPAAESSNVRALARAGSGAILAGRDAAVHLAGAPPRVLRRRRFADAGADAAPALDRGLVPPSLGLIFANAGVKLSPDVGVEVLAAGSRWLIRDRDRAWIAERLAPGLVVTGGPPLLRLFPTDLLEITEAPESDEEEWTVAYEEGLASFTAARGQVVRQAARSDQPILTEIAALARADHVPGGTQLVLASPLRRGYDRQALRICGNVVPVTQGDTVPAEVLGSGAPAEARQQFVLRRAPVTHMRAAQGIDSSLQIRVKGGRATQARPRATQPDGQRWQETNSFLLDGPADRVYVARRDEQGRTSVHFGDGVHGARLPSGVENVVASYRCGAGQAGNVAAGTLIALRRRPIGIRTVTNPMPATEGQDAQTIADLRVRAPWQREPCRRIVSLADYATFAAGFPGVGTAWAQLVQAAQPTACLWIIAEDGTPLDDMWGLHESLMEAVAAARSDRLALHVGGFATRTFRIAARIAAREAADPDVVTTRARAALLAAFSPSAYRAIGGASPALVEAVLEGVPGVANAQVTSYQVIGRPPGSAGWTGATAGWDPAKRRLVPPTLDLVDPDGIALEVRRE